MAEERVQRRLAAILAADVVGYSQLMQIDEAGTLAAMKYRRREVLEPTVKSYQGRLFKLLGDGVLIEFASGVNAVQCAVELQQRMAAADEAVPADRRIVLRIAVNLGDVMVEGGDIYGDGVNIAKRLEALAEPGGIVVSGTAYDNVRNKVAVGFDDLGPQALKNIIELVRCYRVVGTPQAMPRAATPVTDEPSIAVLPFTNMSGDPEQEFFSDGITEDIITELSRFRSLFVIARNTSFTFKQHAVDVQAIAGRLGVRYVVEGSVRRAGNRVRVTAQLIDARTGHHLWAERYDRNLEDIFAVQDEVTQRIVTNIAPRLHSEETLLARRKLPDDMRAYDHYLRAKLLIDTPRDLADLERGREHCRSALAIDPAYARAHAYSAFSHMVGAIMKHTGDPTPEFRKALELAERAVALDENDNICHWAVGEAAFHLGQKDRALAYMTKAVALNPNDADVLIISSYIQCTIGDAGLGFRQMAMAIERNPSNPAWYKWLSGVSLARHGRYEEALAALDLYVPPNPAVMKWRSFVLAKLGRMDEARAQMRALLAAVPQFKAVDYDQIGDDFVATLRAAGLPE